MVGHLQFDGSASSPLKFDVLSPSASLGQSAIVFVEVNTYMILFTLLISEEHHDSLTEGCPILLKSHSHFKHVSIPSQEALSTK